MRHVAWIVCAKAGLSVFRLAREQRFVSKTAREAIKAKTRIVLMAQVATKRPIPAASSARDPLVLEPAAVLVQLIALLIRPRVFVSSIDLLSLNVELAQLMHIVYHLVTHLNSLPRLLKCVLVPVYLRQDRTVLQLKFTYDKDLSHSVGDALLFEVKHAEWQLLEGMFYALGAFFQHLHLLVTEGHVMKHYEQMIHISSALGKVNGVHYPISLL